MSSFEALQQVSRERAIEILAEWELYDCFGENADHVWANEYGRAAEKVRRRHINFWFRPKANDDQLRFAISDRIKREPAVVTDGLRALCPYECTEHSLPADEKGGFIAYV